MLLQVYYVPRRAIYQSATLPTIYGGFGKLRDVIIRENVDLVHAHQAFSAMGNEAVIHARTMNIPAVFTDHSLFGFADASSILMNKALKFSLADVQRVICVSHTSRENTVLRACIPPARVHVVPNAVDTHVFYPPVFHDEAALKRADETIVIMSRLVYRKGIDLLAAVLPRLAELHPKIRFVIGGDGPKRDELEDAIKLAQIEDRVTLAGAIAHKDVRSFLSQGSIFLNCSLTEAFCVALVEAAAVGLLVVSTRVGGVPEVLPDDMMMLAEASPSGIIDAINRALYRLERINNTILDQDEELVKGRYARACAQHNAITGMYSWGVVAERTERVYHKAIDSNTGVAERMKRYLLCGKWFGKICCLIAAFDWLYLCILEYLYPAHRIPRAKDFPFPYNTEQ